MTFPVSGYGSGHSPIRVATVIKKQQVDLTARGFRMTIISLILFLSLQQNRSNSQSVF